jgi:hypothetical protein
MKASVAGCLAAVILGGCGSVPYRYDGSDAATLAGADILDWTNRSTTMVVEVNGQHRGLPYTIHPITVRPGVLKVGVHFRGGGGALSAGCFEVNAAAGGYYQFTSTVVDGGFLVHLHEGQGEDRRLVGKIFMPLRRWMEVPAYCPGATRS